MKYRQSHGPNKILKVYLTRVFKDSKSSSREDLDEGNLNSF
jgi:hypothetical protein